MTGLITFSGLGSGLDVESIVTALTAAERAPTETTLNRQQNRAQTSLSAIGQLKSSLSDFQTALAGLQSINNSRLATSSDDTQLTATATSSSGIGSFDVTIVQTASNTEYSSNLIAGADGTTVLGDGNLTFANGNGDNFAIAVGATDDLNSIVSNINNDANNFGITATLVAGDAGAKIIYRSTQTGDEFDFTVTNDNANLAAISDGNGGTLNKDLTAQDAQIQVAGLDITSASNTFTGAVNGVTLTLDNKAVAGTITVDVEKDIDNVKTNIESFVDSYNDFISTANSLGSAEEGLEGALLGDATLRNIISQVRNVISATVASAPIDQNTLSLIGITTQRDGTLLTNSTNLDNALNNNFDAVASLFSATDGIVASLDTIIDPYTEFSGILENRETSLNSELSRISDLRADLDFRIAKFEDQLRAKYAAMDAIVSQFSFTATFLEQQLAPRNNNE
jgi:flagellar hook-associated protein 2